MLQVPEGRRVLMSEILLYVYSLTTLDHPPTPPSPSSRRPPPPSPLPPCRPIALENIYSRTTVALTLQRYPAHGETPTL